MNRDEPFPIAAIVIDVLGTAFLTLGLLGLFAPELASGMVPIMADRNTAFVCVGVGAAMILYGITQILGYAQRHRGTQQR